jgi:two-component system chemotaxis sensor kinase CheA
MKLLVLQQLAHELESMLDAARRGKYRLVSASITVILAGADILKRFVAELANQIAGVNTGRTIDLPIPQLIRDVHALLDGALPPPGAATSPAPKAKTDAAPPAPAPIAPAAPPAVPSSDTVAAIEAGSQQGAAVVAVEPQAPAPAPAVAKAPPASPAAAPVIGSGIVRVDTLKLDSLIDLVGELVIAQSMVVQTPELKAITSAHLSRSLGQLRSITSDLQRTAMSLRMVPIRSTFQKMSRLVRDLALQQGKEIVLELEGEETELDRNIVEELSDPLVHMIRNSADHGVEMPDVRVAGGKPALGTIHLRAFHQGGNIVIQIQDDGAGLNKERILAKAIEKGLVKPGETLPDKDIFALIFAAGFSTAEKITDISGRGVGMDVVRRNIEKLRGKIDIDSVPGQGTTFSIFLPLTLAIIDGMIVSVGGERYIIPTLAVRESFRPRTEMLSTVHERGEMVNVRGKLCPLLRLYDYFDQPTKITEPTDGIVVVVESGNQTRCLLVDELIGKQEVVIKSLGGALRKNPSLAGGAVLGDGRVGLILNVDALVKLNHALPLAA